MGILMTGDPMPIKIGRKTILDVDDIIGDNTALIILKNTGVFYSAQCGGVGCEHPNEEGFLLQVGNLLQDFDDCSFGCSHIGREGNEIVRIKLANEINKELIKQTKSWTWSIRFDFSRIDELIEGWFPVLVYGEFDSFHNTSFVNQKGILHTGNCD